MNENEILKYAIEHGMIDVTTICKDIEMNERQFYLSKHECAIWQDKNGYYITYVPDETKPTKRRLVKKKHKSDLEDVIIKAYRGELKSLQFGDIFKEWISEKVELGEIMKQTYDRYIYDYDRFIKGTKIDKTSVNNISESLLDDCIRHIIHDNNMSAKRWANTRALIVGTMKYAKRKGYSNFSITAFLDGFELSHKMFKKSMKSDDTQVFTNEEIRKVEEYILKQPKSPTNLAILFDFQTGLRVGELSALKPTDVKGNYLYVLRTEERYKNESGHYVRVVREQTKGKDGQRKIVLTSKALEILEQIKEFEPDGEYIFTSKGDRIKGNNISNKLTKICKHIGITPKSLHKVRKTYASNLLSAGVDEKIIEKQMGHTDIEITRNYYYYNKHSDREVQEILANAINW